MTSAAAMSPEEERLRPLYARVLRLRQVDPSGMLCFVFFEGTVVFGLLLALAELVSWWGALVLPATVAVMVKVNDVVAAAVVRSAARVPAQERERFRREIQPAIGRASVPRRSLAEPGQPIESVAAGSAATVSVTGWSGGQDGPAPEAVGSGGTAPARFNPVARPPSMTAVVRARMETSNRRGPRPDPAGKPRPGVNNPDHSHPTGIDRSGSMDVDRSCSVDDVHPADADRSRPPDGDRSGRAAGDGARPVATDSPGGAHPASPGRPVRSGPASVPDRPAGTEGTAWEKERAKLLSPRAQQTEAPPVVGGGRRSNSRRIERADQRPIRSWLARLDPIGTARQRARQSARRRYE